LDAGPEQVRFGAVRVGDSLPEERRLPSRLQVFRYSAVTWNSHRIHFDSDYAADEGYPDVLVQSHLHGAFLTTLCTNWMGSQGRLSRLEVTVKRYAVPGDVLVCRGTVEELVPIEDDKGIVRIALTETREADQVVCAAGSATVVLPL
jgi:acyl dehydratase